MSLTHRMRAVAAAHATFREQANERVAREARRAQQSADASTATATTDIEPSREEQASIWLANTRFAWRRPAHAIIFLTTQGYTDDEARHAVSAMLERARLIATTYWELGPERAADVLEVGQLPAACVDAALAWLAETWPEGAAHPLAPDHPGNWLHLFPEFQEPEHFAWCDDCASVARMWRELRWRKNFGPAFGDPTRARFAEAPTSA